MMLSDKTIKEYIAATKIKIFPEFNPEDIRPTGIRLHLGSELLIPVEGQTVDLESCQEVRFTRVSLLENSFILRPNQFILATTYEKFQVPRDIVCHLEGRSTVARLGLAIHCTSGIIDGNYEEARTIVLEIKNWGPFEIVLRYQMALALLSFTQLTAAIEQGAQKQYQGQEGALGPNLEQQKE